MSKMTDRIILNVGGRRFETTILTLQSGPSTFFRDMFSEVKTVDTPEIFIDQSGKIFEFILEVIRNPRALFPRKYEHALAYYGISPYNVNFDDNRNERQTLAFLNTIIFKLDNIIRQQQQNQSKSVTNRGIIHHGPIPW